MRIGDIYRYIVSGDPAIPKGTKVRILSIESKNNLSVPRVYAAKVSSKDKQEYIFLAHELEKIND